MSKVGAALAAALALAGPAGAGTIRVAVPSLEDPVVAWNLERHARPDLCGPPRRLSALRWRLSCDAAPRVAAALRAHGVEASVHGRRVDARTAFAWRRFPRFLERLTVPGTSRFRQVERRRGRIVATRPGLRLEFVRLGEQAGAAAFLRGEVDVAPVPFGDLHAPELRRFVRVRPLDAVDAVVLPASVPLALRQLYRSAANRGDYVLLADDGMAPPAYGLLHGSPAASTGARDAKRRIKLLPKVRVRVAGDPDRAAVVVANWRDLGLGPVVDPRGKARFVRLTALYPGPEGLFLALGGEPGPLLREALAAADPRPALARLDARLAERAEVVPIAWSLGAQLVAPRLRGFRQDPLGLVDYAGVKVKEPVASAGTSAAKG